MAFDVVVVGAGPAGLCFARALAGSGLQVALVEQQAEEALAAPPYDGREIALNHASAATLRELGLWDRIDADDRPPLRDAHVLSGTSPFALAFDHPGGDREELGYLVSNHLLRRLAYESVASAPHVTLLCGRRVAGVQADDSVATVRLADGERLDASLIVAADNRFSETRRAMGIPASMHDFGRTMLVCRMAHETPHRGVATEWFDYGQTVALLPLREGYSSLVLTLPSRQIEPLLTMAPDAFARTIEVRLRCRLGAMSLDSERCAYPLVGVYADRFAARRFALVGDAAVGMHPVTAHGFNFGLLGAQSLAQLLRDARARGTDIAAPALLQRYERDHRVATRGLYLATLALVRLYTNDAPPARLARAGLLRVANRIGPFKRMVVSALTDERAPLPGPLAQLAAALPPPP